MVQVKDDGGSELGRKVEKEGNKQVQKIFRR